MATLESLIADGGVRKIIVRGDCCSLRAVSHNMDLFPNLDELVTGEKAPNICYLDALRGVRIAPGQVMNALRAEDMDAPQFYYLKRQFLLDGVLDATGADLIVMDSYSDMNFPLYRDRESGALVWLDQTYAREPETLRRDFEFVGRRSFADAVDDNVRLIEHLRTNNPGAPVLYLSQPIDYYPALRHRLEFNYLGNELAKRVENFHWGGTLSKGELDPVELDSCGPGETLHFTAGTYRRMIANAFGPAAAGDSLKSILGRDPERFVSLYRPEATLPPQSESHGAHVSRADFNVGTATVECSTSCKERVAVFRKSLVDYALFEGDAVDRPLGYHAALLPLLWYADFQAFVDAVKPLSKGNKVREARKAEREGYYCKPFPWALHVPDIHAINHSELERSGGTMSGGYLRSVEEMGGYPTKRHELAWPNCSYHWNMQWGVFVKDPEHKQGEIAVGERLLGYISLVRCGNVALYSQILGHGEYLGEHVMALLHFEIVKWILDGGSPFTKDLEYLMYGGWESGSGDSLRDWKRRVGFAPFWSVASVYKAPIEDTVDEFGL